jgi:hypothetical protein
MLRAPDCVAQHENLDAAERRAKEAADETPGSDSVRACLSPELRCTATIRGYALDSAGPEPVSEETGEHPMRTNHAFAFAIAISLLVGAAVMFGSLHAATSHIQVTM